MKRSLLLKMGLLLGITASMEANAQVFNAHDIEVDFYYYGGYNAMALGQGALADAGNNIWNGFGNVGGPGSADSFGGNRSDDGLYAGNPGNPYAWAGGYFATGNQLFSPADFSSTSAGNANSDGSLSTVTIPYMNFSYYTWDTIALDPEGSTRTDVPTTLFSACTLVNTSAPGAGTAANPQGVMVLSNVPPGTYDLYLYGANPDGTRGASFIVDSGTPTNGVYQAINPNAVAGEGPLADFELGVDYVVYNNVTPNADSTIHISWGAVSNSISGLSGEGDFNGLQLAVSTPFPAAPVFIQPPASATFLPGVTASLTGLARGNPAVALQWYEGNPPGTALPGQTNSTLTYTAATIGESGNYYLVATNIYGATTSSVVTLTITGAPLITGDSLTTSSNEVVLYSGHNHFGLSVTAFGDPTQSWSYYWQSNGVITAVTTNMPSTNGVGTSSYHWINTTASATYGCVVSNSYGTGTNGTALAVTIVAPPATPFASALLGLSPFAYWPMDETSVGFTYDYVGGNNGTPMAGSDYTVGQPGPTTGFGAFSSAYTFDGTDSAVDVPGANINFTGPMTMITWVMSQPAGFRTVAGKGDSSYRIDVDQNGLAHFNDDGPNDVQGGPIVDAGAWHQIVGTYNGNSLALYVDGNLVATEPGAATTTGDGNDFNIGGAPDYPGGRNIVGSVAQVALLTNVLTAAQVEALFKAGQTPIFIATEPASVTGFQHGTVDFSVMATGGDPVTYQWSGPAGPIAGATNATLVLTNLTGNTPVNNGPGIYYCTIENPYSTTNTPEDGSVELTVNSTAPTFVQDLPPTFYGLLGSTVVLPVIEGGNPPITNQWLYSATTTPPNTALRNGGRISGANSTNLVITDAQAGDAGYYQVMASNNVAPYVNKSQVVQLFLEPAILFNSTGAGWTANGGIATFTGDLLTLTTGGSQQDSSAFFDSPVYVGAFKASFTYTASGGADGTTFCIQNAPAGQAALGAAGGSLGYAGITNSVALALDLYTANPGGIQFVTGGFNPNNGVYTFVYPVTFTGGHPINVTLGYDGQTLAVNLTDTVNASVFSTNLVVGAISQYVGTNIARVGFTAATGGVTSTQTIGNFTYVPVPLLTATHSGTNTVVTWPSAVGGYSLQEASSLGSPAWTTVAGPYTLNGANNQVTVPATTGTQFFRLVLP